MPDDVTMIVGSATRYHKSDCHVLGRVPRPKIYSALESASFRAAVDGRSPCELCNPPQDPDWDDLARHIVVVRSTEDIDVSVMRRNAAAVLDPIFGSDVEQRSLKARVLDLRRSDRVPTDVANCLHMICDLRNIAEHEGQLTELQVMITRLCWALVKKWGATQTQSAL